MTDTVGPLAGRVALVTGVSRRAGIGLAVAHRLRELGAVVVPTGWLSHDAGQPWGVDPIGDDPTVEQHDLGDAAVPAALVDQVVDRHGALDIVVAVHARSSSQDLLGITADELDASWAVNVRSVLLLARRFAERHDPTRPGGRMVWFTSGQDRSPMGDELPYAVTKAALHQMTASLADQLIDRGIVANAINPGPVDTGWADATTRSDLSSMFPTGRWGTPGDVANLVAFLVGDDGAWIVGQVIDSEGGFRRHRPPRT